MKTIVAGSRSANDYQKLLSAIQECGWVITSVVSGGARGADALGERYAAENKLPLEIYPADWDTFGKRAGHVRNRKMALRAEALIALWDGQSPGTRNMIAEANKLELKVHVAKP